MRLALTFCLLAFICVGASAQTGTTTIDPIAMLRGTSTNLEVLTSNGSGRTVWRGISGLVSGGAGITVSPAGVITNAAPDQPVGLTAGSGITVTGSYPNFTIASTVTQTPFQSLTLTGPTPTVLLSNGGGGFFFAATPGGEFTTSSGSISYTPTVQAYQAFTHSGTTSTLSNGGGAISVVGSGAATVTQTGGTYTVNVAASAAPNYTARKPFAVGSNIAVGGTYTTTGVTLPPSTANFLVILDGSIMDAKEGGSDTDWDYDRTGASQLTWNRQINAGSKILVLY